MPAIFGLLVRPRPYRCDVCNHVHDVSTNHTDMCFSVCPNCQWRSGFDTFGRHYRADIGKERPHYYVGEEPGPDEYNPHLKR